MILSERTTRQGVVSTARHLTENSIPVLLSRHGLKKPQADSSGTWLTFDDPDEVARAIEQQPQAPNLSVLLQPKLASPLVAVDVDGIEAMPKLQDLGISKNEGSWQVRSGRGGLIIFYWNSGGPLPRIVKAGGLPLDLLSNGYALVPPSDTSAFKDQRGQGGPYRWVEGHSPFDIPAAELESPSALLIEFWLASAQTSPAQGEIVSESPQGKAWHLTRQPIPQGRRNDSLTRIAGWLRHYHPEPIVTALLMVVNDARCSPPLENEEVERIVSSVFRYPQEGVNGHPRAVVPSFTRRVDIS